MPSSDLKQLEPTYAAARVLLRQIIDTVLPFAQPGLPLLYAGPLIDPEPLRAALAEVTGSRIPASGISGNPPQDRGALGDDLPDKRDSLPAIRSIDDPADDEESPLLWGSSPPCDLTGEERQRLEHAVLVDTRAALELLRSPASGQSLFPSPPVLAGVPECGDPTQPALRMRMDTLPLAELLRAAGALRRSGHWIFFDEARFATIAVSDEEVDSADVQGLTSDLTLVERISVVESWRDARAVFIPGSISRQAESPGVPIDALAFELMARRADEPMESGYVELTTAEVARSLLRAGLKDTAMSVLRRAESKLECRLISAHVLVERDPLAAAVSFRAAVRSAEFSESRSLSLIAQALANALLLEAAGGVIPGPVAAEAARNWSRSRAADMPEMAEVRLVLKQLVDSGDALTKPG